MAPVSQASGPSRPRALETARGRGPATIRAGSERGLDAGIDGYSLPTSRHPWRGAALHYVDVHAPPSGEPQKPAVVLLHGNPTWSYLYRSMIPPLAQHFRVIAPDLIGFGLSTKPRDPALLTFESHVDSIVDLLTALDLREAVLVGQDWGGPIVSAAAASGALSPAGLVLMNTYLPGQPLHFGPYSWMFHRPWSSILVERFDLLRLVAFRLGFARRPSPAVLAAYRLPHRHRDSRAAILGLLQAVPDPRAAADHALLTRVDEYLRSGSVAKLLLFSDGDRIFDHRLAQRLSGEMAAAQFELVRGAGHFLQEDAGPEVARRILAWAGPEGRPT